jgi:hypothetical protein
MFLHTYSIGVFRSYIQSWNFATIIIIIIGVKGGRDSNDEKKLMITNGECEFDQDVLVMVNNFKMQYDQLLKVYNGS